MVVAPRVVRRERAALVVVGAGPTRLLAAGCVERADGAVEAELRERLGLARARAEAGAPEQALRLRGAERPLVGGDRGTAPYLEYRAGAPSRFSPERVKAPPERGLSVVLRARADIPTTEPPEPARRPVPLGSHPAQAPPLASS